VSKFELTETLETQFERTVRYTIVCKNHKTTCWNPY